MGEDGVASFRTAVVAYVRAVDVADRARAEWVAEGRPIVFRQPNGATGVHPLVSALWSTSRSVTLHGGQVGLTPMSAARLMRLGERRGRGRPVGANSSPDRRALPPLQLADPPGVLMVNRARGNQEE
jgi:hypothetical protein